MELNNIKKRLLSHKRSLIVTGIIAIMAGILALVKMPIVAAATMATGLGYLFGSTMLTEERKSSVIKIAVGSFACTVVLTIIGCLLLL